MRLYEIQTHIWTKNIGHKSKSLYKSGSMLYVSAVLKNLSRDKHTFSFWLPSGNQNECCIGSGTKTLKAMEVALNCVTVALNVRVGGLTPREVEHSNWFK